MDPTVAGGTALDLKAEIDPVYRFISSRTGNDRAAAEDIAQETFLAALGGGFDPEAGSLRSWLLGIAIRKIADHQRRAGVAGRHLAPVAREMAIRMVREPLPDEWVERRESRALVNEALARIPEADAVLLTRKYFTGAGVAELAAELGASGKAVESRLTRARLAFHEAVQRLQGDP